MPQGTNTVATLNLNSANIGTSNSVKSSGVRPAKRTKYTLGRAASRLYKKTNHQNVVSAVVSKQPRANTLLGGIGRAVAQVCNNVQQAAQVGKLPKQFANYAEFMQHKTAEAAKDKGKNPVYPTKAQLIKNTRFGKPDGNHSYTTEKVFDHTLLHVLKSGFLEDADTKALKNVRVDFEVLVDMLEWSKDVNFETLKLGSDRYRTQEEITSTRKQLLAACLLHYDLHIPSVIRYLDGEYTANFRRVEETLAVLRKHDCPEALVDELERIILVGCPNHMNAEGTRENFMQYLKYGNHTTISANLEKVMKVMNKEERHSFLVALPGILARFFPDMHLTPQSLLKKPERKDRLVWDGSFLIAFFSVCTNMLMD